jgi:DNA-3-methyladenine glycosylase
MNRLPREFYRQDVIIVARELLGKLFIRNAGNKIISGRIVEVEAYDHPDDPAAHSYRGETPRNSVMFGDGGYLYVYFIYGIHHCLNVVTGRPGEGKAVLIRGLEPVTGIEEMSLRRYGRPLINDREYISLLNGPAKIAKAFDTDLRYNGEDLCSGEFSIADDVFAPAFETGNSPRIGITRGKEMHYRFYIKSSPFVL